MVIPVQLELMVHLELLTQVQAVVAELDFILMYQVNPQEELVVQVL